MTKEAGAAVSIPDIGAEAEHVILSLKDNKGNLWLKTSQIRKFLAAVNTLTNRIAVYRARNAGAREMSALLGEQVKYLKVKFAYQAGREPDKKKYEEEDRKKNTPVRVLGEKAEMAKRIDRIGLDIGEYERFAQFIEALVAYHKFYGGRDS